MLVKICGLRTIDHALAAATAGADLIGLVFAPSRRRVSPAEGAAIAAAVRARPVPRPQIVGLFVNTPLALIHTVAGQVGLDMIQLSGDEPAALAAHVALPVIKSLRLSGSAAEAEWVALAAAGGQAPGQTSLPSHRSPPLLLVDAHVPGAYGGTGVRADWERAAALAPQVPLILAGGLSAQTVAAAIATVRPAGVDVSSGVETNGAKDVAKIEAFIAAARSTC